MCVFLKYFYERCRRKPSTPRLTWMDLSDLTTIPMRWWRSSASDTLENDSTTLLKSSPQRYGCMYAKRLCSAVGVDLGFKPLGSFFQHEPDKLFYGIVTPPPPLMWEHDVPIIRGSPGGWGRLCFDKDASL